MTRVVSKDDARSGERGGTFSQYPDIDSTARDLQTYASTPLAPSITSKNHSNISGGAVSFRNQKLIATFNGCSFSSLEGAACEYTSWCQ